MKIIKYISDTKKDNLKTKLLSYSALSAAFLIVDSEAHAQCGVADAGSPALAIDIDGDGNPDVNINFNTFAGSASTTNTVPGASVLNLFSSLVGTITASTYIGPNFSYYGCQPVAIPGQYGNGLGGGSFFQGTPGLGSYTTLTATAQILYQVNALNTFLYYFTFVSGSGAYAIASGVGSNNIVGLTAGASNFGVCNLIDSAPGVTGPDSVSLGSIYNLDYYFFNVQAAASIQYEIAPAVASIALPTTTCLTNSYATYGVYLPPALPIIASYPGFASTSVGPFGIGGSNVSTANVTGSNINSNLLAVQFDINGETHNGWIELEYDTTTGAVTCLNTGYNACSLEVASAAGVLTNACIDVSQADPQNDCEAAPPTTDIPTLSQWGLITLMLMLMSYGAIAMSNFGELAGLLKRKEEEELV